MSKIPTSAARQDRGFKALLYENRFSFLSFFCAVVLMLLVFYCFDMAPFGDVTILRMDLYHQYGPLFAELYERIKGGRSLLYSWNTGMGGSFLGNFYNYLASPLLVVLFLFRHEDVPDAISLMVLLKAAFSAAFFTYYLRKTQNRANHVTAAFGVLYAFSGFFIAYYWNVMWLDAMVLFPLAMLGIERIIERRGFLLYTVSLAVIMISNYYMAMMVCIFSVLYFLVRYFSQYSIADKLDAKKRRFSLRNSRFLTSGVSFAFGAVLAAMLAMFALLPTVFVLRNCSATSGSFPKDFKIYYTIFDFLANHLASVEPTIRSSGEDVLPNVYCGILTVMLIPLYLLSGKIKLREKVSHVLLLGVLYFSFNINYANYVWHGFHFPNDLPYRFSFMYSFVLLVMAFRAITHIREFTGKQLLLNGIGVMGFIVLVQEIGSKNVGDATVLISLAFAFIYTLVLAAMRSKKIQASSLALLLLCCVISEAAIADTDNYSMNQTKTNYSGDYADFADIKASLDAYDGSAMYRMELADLRTRMDPAWYDYNGLSTFSSMASEKLSNLQSHLGMYGNFINSYTYHPQTPVYNAMMSLKYVVKKKDATGLENTQLYKHILTNDTYQAYKNEYCLPVAFCVNSLVENWNDSDANPFDVQADFLRRAVWIDSIYAPMAVTDVYCDNIDPVSNEDVQSGNVSMNKRTPGSYGSMTVTIAAVEAQNCYLYVKSGAVDTVYANGENLNATQSIDEAYILDLGFLQQDEEIEVEVPLKDDSDYGSVTFYAVGIDMDMFEKAYQALQSGALQLTKLEETRIEGTFTAKDNQILYTSIPYDEGWRIQIDGEKVSRKDYLRIGGALLGLRVDEGAHTIVMRYEPLGLRLGTEVSVCALVLLLLGLLLSKRRQKRKAFVVTTPRLLSVEEIPSPYELEMQTDELPDDVVSAPDEQEPDDGLPAEPDAQESFTVQEEVIGEDFDAEEVGAAAEDSEARELADTPHTDTDLKE